MAHKRSIAMDAYASQSKRPWHSLGSCRSFTTCFLVAAATVGAVYLGLNKSGFLWTAARDQVNAAAQPDDLGSFVRTSGTQFELHCRPFHIAGFNGHDLVAKALINPWEYSTENNKTGQQIISESFALAAAAGFNVVRTYAHSTDPKYPFQDIDGEWREDVLEALDFVIETARAHGLRVMLSFADNWKYLGGVPEYLDRSTTAPERQQNRPPDGSGDSDLGEYDEATRMYELERHTLFYTDEGARDLYRQHVRKIVQRRNSISGIAYKDDPIILGWALLNELRCESWRVPECPNRVQRWIEEMAGFVKEQDPRHLLTVGMEGFWGKGSLAAGANPGQWAEETGQNFTRNHSPSSIDFATTHVWPDNWEQEGAEFQMQWLAGHIKEAEDRLHKPLLLEEFGKKLDKSVGSQQFLTDIKEKRDPIFRTLLAIAKASIKTDRALQGWMFWRWDVPVYAGHHQEDYAVRPSDTTFDYLTAHAHMLRRVQNSKAPRAECKMGCWMAKHAASDPQHQNLPASDRKCVNKPQVCRSYWAAKSIAEEQGAPPTKSAVDEAEPMAEIFPSESACCRPGLGAFRHGCAGLEPSHL